MDRPPGLWHCDCHLRVCGNPATNKELAMKLVKLSLLVVMTALLGSLPAFGRPLTPRDLVMLSHIGHPAGHRRTRSSGLPARCQEWKFGAPGEIRTPDLMVRSHALYPTELRARRLEWSAYAEPFSIAHIPRLAPLRGACVPPADCQSVLVVPPQNCICYRASASVTLLAH